MWDTSNTNFPYKPPLIGPDDYWEDGSPVDWAEHCTHSVYYWWWEYLKRNEGYIQTCHDGGQGPCSELYSDFGDVREGHFPTWWRAKGKYLFAEPEKTYKFKRVTEPLPDSIYSDQDVLIVQVPLGEPSTSLIEQFKDLLDFCNRDSDKDFDRTLSDAEREELRNSGIWPEELLAQIKKVPPPKFSRGVRAARSSQARYPVIGQPNISALEQTLLVYDYWKTPTKKTLWQVAVATIGAWRAFDPTDLNATADKNQMNVEVSRYIKKAKAMIHNAGLGRFPDISNPEKRGKTDVPVRGKSEAISSDDGEAIYQLGKMLFTVGKKRN